MPKIDAGKRKNLSVLITLACRSKCKHCYVNSNDRSASADLELALWSQVLAEFRERGGEELFLHGGEPLEYPWTCQLLEEANRIGLRTSINTNGLLIDDTHVKVFAKCATYTLVSLDGPIDNYKYLRGVDGLDTVTQNIDRLIKAGVTVHPVHVVHKSNHKDLSWITTFCTDRALPRATVSPVSPLGRARSYPHLLLSLQDLTRFIAAMDTVNQTHNGSFELVTQSAYRPDEGAKYIAAEAILKEYVHDYYFAFNDGTLTIDIDLPDPRAWSFGAISDLSKVDEYVSTCYRRLMDGAFDLGLSELQSGKTLIWPDVVQRYASMHNCLAPT